jgi:hypothetical protein
MRLNHDNMPTTGQHIRLLHGGIAHTSSWHWVTTAQIRTLQHCEATIKVEGIDFNNAFGVADSAKSVADPTESSEMGTFVQIVIAKDRRLGLPLLGAVPRCSLLSSWLPGL